ncbi:MAG TPA: CCA tRNA nucleotidyltransferase [Candidatus Binatia bacterium]|nr:CCA tRNA nucleotidyltransferase [Candidatus Binatia bacterium]
MSTRSNAISVVERLRQEGFEAFFAGGCVRDMLLHKTPEDYDIATSAHPEDIVRLFSETIPVGAQFGVILVLVDGEPFEVASFRHDGAYLDGRRPSEVRYGTLEEDVQRRDFTINGMLYDPLADRVIDLVEGREDLAQRRIRAIGDPQRRFEEDRLRMLRAVRFAAALDFVIEDVTFAAIQRMAPTISDIAWERIGDEITRILMEGGARRGFELLDQSGLLQVVLPEIEALKGTWQSPDYHPEGDVFVHTMLLLSHLQSPSETLAYGCLLHDVAKPVCSRRDGERATFYGHTDVGATMAEDILKRLKRGRTVWERVSYLVRNHLRHVQAPAMRLSTLKRFLREEGIEELLELARIDALSSSGDLRSYQFCKERLGTLDQEEMRPPPLLRGDDLIELGLKPGPLFSEILRRIEDQQLGGEISSRDDALAWVKRNYIHRG